MIYGTNEPVDRKNKKQGHEHGEQTCGCLGGGSGINWEFGVSRCNLFYLEWISNEALLHSPGNYIQSPMRT